MSNKVKSVAREDANAYLIVGLLSADIRGEDAKVDVGQAERLRDGRTGVQGAKLLTL